MANAKYECLECGTIFPSDSLPYPQYAVVQSLLHLAREHGFVGTLTRDLSRRQGFPPVTENLDPKTNITTYQQGDLTARVRTVS